MVFEYAGVRVRRGRRERSGTMIDRDEMEETLDQAKILIEDISKLISVLNHMLRLDYPAIPKEIQLMQAFISGQCMMLAGLFCDDE